MVRIRTTVGIAASKVQPTTCRSMRCGAGSSAIFSLLCSFPRACRCFWPVTSQVTRNWATTTPIARTRRSPGSTGTLAPEQRELLEFVRGLIRLRSRNAVFRRRHFFQGRPIHGLDVKVKKLDSSTPTSSFQAILEGKRAGKNRSWMT